MDAKAIPASGLSPRVRGNRVSPGRPRTCPRSIPACAGEPLPRRENLRFECEAVGLSPRVRGNQGGRFGQVALSGSIPACAGEPYWLEACRRKYGVYPRVCGGTGWPGPRRCVPGGLSPRVRGNLGGTTDHGLRARSIPACAGEPGHRDPRRREPRVYPRVCGGTFGLGHIVGKAVGLSPRVRGNPHPPPGPLGEG